MSHDDVDMDLLRILEQLRNAHNGSTSDSDAADVGSLLEQASERCPGGLVGELFEAVKRSTADGSRIDEKSREDMVDALKIAEEILFAPDDGELGAKLTGLIRSLAPEGEERPTLDDAAALLVRMDPTDTAELVSLHGFVGSLIDSFRSLPDIRNQLNRAAEALDDVTRQEPPEQASREAAVDEVSGIIEHVMKLAEDASFSADPDSSIAEATQEETQEEETQEEETPDPEKPPVGAEAPDESAAQLDESNGSAEETTPGPLPPDADHELIQDFIAEGSDYLDQAEVALLALEQSPKDEESINVVFRAFHTIKGVAGFLGLSSIADLAHHAESLLSRVRERELDFTEPVADITLRSADVLRELLQGVASSLGGGDVEVPANLAGLLEALQSDDLDQRLQDGKIADLCGSGSDESVAKSDAAAPGPSAEVSVRVKTGRLDRLVDLVGELVVAQSMIAEDQTVLDDRSDLYRKVSRADKILRELQDLSTSMRMVPLRPAFQKLNRVVRDVSRKREKSVRFVTEGEDTELDRNMVDVITDPLVHMVRNSIDHGIEPPDERRIAGKDLEGVLTLAAYQAGGSVIIEVSDDGRGLNRGRIVEKAIERGLIESDRAMTDQEVYELIFAPGFSTAAEVTSVSGRGVGMDVVRKAVESLRGRVEIRSTPGEGSLFAIHLPLTLAITDGLVIRAGSQRYILPMVKIHSSFQPRGSDIFTVAGRSEMVQLHEQLLPVIRLHQLYGITDAETNPTEALLVIVGEGSRRSALMVDDILGQQQFVVKALSGQVTETPGIVGGAIMADGAVGLILDPEELIELRRNGAAGGGRSAA